MGLVITDLNPAFCNGCTVKLSLRWVFYFTVASITLSHNCTDTEFSRALIKYAVSFYPEHTILQLVHMDLNM